MYNNNIPQNNNNIQKNRPNYRPGNNDERFLGGFFGPFILGGLTGGLIANSRPNYPIYYSPYPYYQPYPYYPYRYY